MNFFESFVFGEMVDLNRGGDCSAFWHVQFGDMIAPPNVLRAARELLGLKQVDAAVGASISRRTIQRLESGELDRTHASILLQTFYEKQGILFVRPIGSQGWGLTDNSSGSKAASSREDS